MRLFLACLLGLFLNISPALADNLKFGLRGEVLPVAKVHTIYSQEGETLDAFVLRLGVWFRNFTTTSGYEACGTLFQSSDGRYALPIFTNNSQIGCATPVVSLEGFVATNQSVHSHPVEKSATPNAQDKIFIRGTSQRFSAEYRQRRNLDPRTFSDIDFAGGPGFLVADGRVLHQSGPGSVRLVGELPPYQVP